MATSKIKMPKTIGETIDLLYKTREKRLAMQASVDEVKEQEGAITAHLLENFDKQNLDGSKGKLATAAIKRTETPDITDWNAFWEYIRKNKAYDLVQQRASITGLRERWNANKVVPGAASKEVISLSLTKIANKASMSKEKI